jgi:hypothetical protein
MKMKEILDNEFASIFFDEISNSIITIWKKPATTEAYRGICSFVLRKIKEFGVEAIISDIYQQGLVSTENRLWLQKVIVPEIYKGGVRKVAIIAPNDVFSRFYIESIKNGAQSVISDVELNYFNDLISAQTWVLQEEVPA